MGMWRVIWAAEGVLGAEMGHFDHIDARARMCQNDLKCAARRWALFLRILIDADLFKLAVQPRLSSLAWWQWL